MALTPGLEIPFGVQPVNPVPVDSWSGPYSGSIGNDTEAGAKAVANATIPEAIRFQSMEVRLIYGGVAYKYWYRNGTTDNDLELFTSDSGSNTFFSSSVPGSIYTTGSAAFLGNETGVFSPQDKGTDIFFYVSGSSTEKALFGGDVVVSGTLNILQGFSGSLTKLADGTSYLVAGVGIDIVSASNGSITVSTTGASTVAGNDTYVQFNDGGVFGGVSGFTFDKSTNTLTVAGGITGSNSYFTNLTVVGTASIAFLETINQQSLVIGDKYITIASGAFDHTSLDGSGILFGSGAQGSSLSELGSHAQILYRESEDALEIFPGLKVSGSLSVTGETIITGSLTAGALSGSLTTLNDGTSYLIAGNGIDITSASNGSITVSTTGASTVAGSDTQIQFNDGGVFGASNDFAFDKTNKALTLSGSLFINTGSHNPYDYVIAAYQTVDGDKTADFGFSGLQRNALRITGSLISSTRLAINSEYTSNVTAGTSAQSYNGVIGFRTYAEHESEASTTGQGVTGLESFATVQKPETSSTAGNVNIQRGMNMQLGWGNSRGLNYSGSITNVRGIQVAYLNPSAARTTSTLIGARIGLTNGVFGGAGVTDVYGIDIRPLSGSGVKLGVRTYDPIVIGADNINGLEKLRVSGSSYFDGGTATFVSGLSGSLTNLTDGTSAFIAGTGVSISSASNGAVTIATTGASTVAGSDTQIQFNDGGVFGASNNFTYNKDTNLLSLTGSISASSIYIGGPFTQIDSFKNIRSNFYSELGSSNQQVIGLRSIQRRTGTSSAFSNERALDGAAIDDSPSTPSTLLSVIGVAGTAYYTSTANAHPNSAYTGVQASGILSSSVGAALGTVGEVRGFSSFIGYAGNAVSGHIHTGSGYRAANNATITATRTMHTIIGFNAVNQGANSGGGIANVIGVNIARQTGGTASNLGIRSLSPIVINATNVTGSEMLHVSGSSYFYDGAASFVSGLSGSLTNLTDGTSYLVAGAGISITSSSNGSIIITNDGTVGDITAVNAGIGLLGGGTSGDLTIDINDSIVATTSGSTFIGAVNFDQGLSGSLTQLVDGTSAFIAGTGVSISSASNGAVTIATTGASTVAGSDTQVQFNDGGSFGAVSDFTFDKINKELFVSGAILINTASNFDEALSIKQLYTSSLKTSRTAVYVETELTGSNDLNPSGEGDIRGMFVRARNRSKIASPSSVTALQYVANHASTSSLYGMYGVRGDASVQKPNDGNTAGHVRFQRGNLASIGFQVGQDFTGSIGEAAGYLVTTFGNSLDRTITSSLGLHVTDLGAPGVTNAIGVEIDVQSGASTINLGLRTQSPIVIGTTNVAGTEKLRVNGTSRFDDVGNFILGLSGSLTNLTDGTSAFIAGTGVSISSASNGAVTISTTGASTVAGSDTQIQFNDGGAFGADDGFTYDKLNNKLFVSGSVLVGRETPLYGENLSLNSVVTASSQPAKMGAYFNQTTTGHLLPGGNTSQLYGLAVENINRSKNASGYGNTGILSYAVHQSTSSHGQLWGYLGGANARKPLDGNIAGNVDRAIGVYGSIGYVAATNFSGSLSDAVGFFYTNAGINDARTVTNSYGVKLSNVGATQGVTNAIGVDIDQINTASGIKLGLRTQDPIVVGTTNVAGSEKLRVNGTSRFDDVGSFILGLSGSLTRLTDGTSYLVAGDGISVVTGSTGQVTISQNIEWNEKLTGTVDGVNTDFTLAYAPSDNNSLMVFLNGVLLEFGASNDYTISGTTISFVEAPPPESKLTATYSR